jgi:molybdopterin-biosynthesis enzyme MoeA-like protein
MRAMFSASVPMLATGAQILSASVDVYAREGDLAEPLERIARAHPEVEIGSYPFAREGRFGATLVVRGTDGGAVERVRAEIVAAMVALAGEGAVSR